MRMEPKRHRRRPEMFSLARKNAQRAKDDTAFRVAYKTQSHGGSVADLVPRYMVGVRAELAALTKEEREHVLQRVRESLESYGALVEAALAGRGRGPTPAEMKDAVDDIAIWYANEESQGRGAEHVVPIDEPLFMVPVGKRHGSTS